MNPHVVSAIDATLESLLQEQQIKIPLAIESGSRAWGFPSPDSDYDCRFVYVRSRHEYVALFPKRDVIELPVTEVFDVNGWDLAKAVKLLLKGNAVIVEWLTSPIIYRGDSAFRQRFLTLAEGVLNRNAVAHHYLHMAYNQQNRWLNSGEEINIKKLFYLLRPVVALRWLRQRPGQAVAPMNFPTLCHEADLQQSVAETIEQLRAIKAETREMGTGTLPNSIRTFLDDEIAAAQKAFSRPVPPGSEFVAAAEAFFRNEVGLDTV